MYKEIAEQIKHGTFQKTEKTFSEDEVVAMLKSLIIEKSLEHPEITIEELEKGLKNAFKAGLSVLGLIHGAHQVGSTDSLSTTSQEQSISKTKPSRPFSENSYGGKQVQSFLGTVGNLSSSNIRGMDSETHDDRLSNIISRYKTMSDEEVDQHLEKFPTYRRNIEQHHANNVFKEYGGDFKSMSDAWNKKPEIKQKQPETQQKQPEIQPDQNNSDQYRDIASN